MVKDLSYYMTWTEQSNAIKIPLKKTEAFHYVLEDDSKLYDLSSCSYHLNFGLKNEKIQAAIAKQLQDAPVIGPKFTTDFKENTTKALLEFMELEGKVFYTTSGSESVENAIKIARDVTNKNYILRRKNSYHGATLGSLSLTGDWRADGFKTLDNYSLTIPEPGSVKSLEETEKVIKNHHNQGIAAIILETVTGGNGVIIPTKDWFKGIEKLCRKYDILLILDEVVCGFYRTGKAFGYMHFDITPDLVCLSKGISGGFIPFGAVFTNREISKHYENKKLKCGLTNYAHPLGLAAMAAVIEICQNNSFLKNLQELEEILTRFKKSINDHPSVKEVRHIGHLMAIELYEAKSMNDLIKKGLYLNCVGKNMILASFLTQKPEVLENTLNILKSKFFR